MTCVAFTRTASGILPVTKLIAKKREGSHVHRIFDDPKTPYQRILDSSQVSDMQKTELKAIHAKLDLVELKAQIDKAIDGIKPSCVCTHLSLFNL
jgi:hypothetical protein